MEVGDNPPVLGVHVGPVGVEDADHPNVKPVLAVVVEEQGLGAALAFVVTGAYPNWVHPAPVALGLGVHIRVTVDLAGGGLQYPRASPLGQPEHVDRPVHAGLGGLDRVVLVVHRRGRARQVVDPVHLHVERKCHIVSDELEAGMGQQVSDIFLATGEEVIQADHLVPVSYKPPAKVRPYEARAAGDECLEEG
jgi:hypothetical protein